MAAQQEADFFLIPLLNGDHALGQIIEVEKTPSNSVLCLLTMKRLRPSDKAAPLALSELISLVLVHPDHLIDGTWPVIGFEQLPDIQKVFKLDAAKANNFEDILIHDPAIVEAFMNACHGHYPWDGFPDPTFFDNFLIDADGRPAGVKMQADFPT